MAIAQAPLLTADDYRLMPETGPRYQLVEGELIMSPAPNRYHQDISRNIEFLLLKYLEKNPIGEVYDAPFDVYLGEHSVFQPDLVRCNRMPKNQPRRIPPTPRSRAPVSPACPSARGRCLRSKREAG